MLKLLIKKIYQIIYSKVESYFYPTLNPQVNNSLDKSGKKIMIGAYTYGYEKLNLATWGEDTKVVIGKFCSISSGLILFCGGNHRVDWITTYPFGHVPNSPIKSKAVIGTPKTKGDIIIGNDVWIGKDVIIMSGITIGDGAVISANSNVVKDIPPYSIFGGNPAKLLKKRFPEEFITEFLEIRWWDYPIEDIEKIIPFLCNQQNLSICDNIAKIKEILNRA